MPRDNQRFVVILEGNDGFFPVTIIRRVRGRRKALLLKKKMMRHKDITNKRITIKKDNGGRFMW